MEQGVTLASLTNHAEDAIFLQSSVRRWLDQEYIVQPVHEEIGNRCAAIYSESRRAGVSDLGEMLVTIGTQLEGLDFKNAFVGAWDCANKCADLLMTRMELELCECAGDLSWAMEPRRLAETAKELSSEFERYRFLQRFLEGEVPLSAVAPVMALSLGFRDGPATPAKTSQVQVQALAPLGWEGLASPPDFSDLGDSALDARLSEDLPEDSGGVDVALEALVGLEYYKALKRVAGLTTGEGEGEGAGAGAGAGMEAAVGGVVGAGLGGFLPVGRDAQTPPASAARDTARRILLAQWLYAYSFIPDFPHSQRFVPAHLAYRLE